MFLFFGALVLSVGSSHINTISRVGIQQFQLQIIQLFFASILFRLLIFFVQKQSRPRSNRAGKSRTREHTLRKHIIVLQYPLFLFFFIFLCCKMTGVLMFLRRKIRPTCYMLGRCNFPRTAENEKKNRISS